MMKLTIMILVAIADLGEDVRNEIGSAQPNALIVMSVEIEARAWRAPLPQSPHPISRANRARLRPVCPLMRPTILEPNTITCHLMQAVPEIATQHARLKLRRRTYQSSVDNVVPQHGHMPRHSVGRAELRASRFLSWPSLNDGYQES